MTFLVYEDDGVVVLENGLGYLLLEAPDVGTDIQNSGATIIAPTRVEACERSGFRALPHELTKEPYTERMVLKEFRDYDHDDRQNRISNRRSRPKKVETRKEDENFISTAVTQDDL